jgi:DNA modification methylase
MFRDHYNYIHPTQKPLELMRILIKMTTKENDVILEPFSGSGSTAIAALKEYRKIIAIEIDKEYHQLSLNRLADEKTLFN